MNQSEPRLATKAMGALRFAQITVSTFVATEDPATVLGVCGQRRMKLAMRPDASISGMTAAPRVDRLSKVSDVCANAAGRGWHGMSAEPLRPTLFPERSDGDFVEHRLPGTERHPRDQVGDHGWVQ